VVTHNIAAVVVVVVVVVVVICEEIEFLLRGKATYVQTCVVLTKLVLYKQMETFQRF